MLERNATVLAFILGREISKMENLIWLCILKNTHAYWPCWQKKQKTKQKKKRALFEPVILDEELASEQGKEHPVLSWLFKAVNSHL